MTARKTARQKDSVDTPERVVVEKGGAAASAGVKPRASPLPWILGPATSVRGGPTLLLVAFVDAAGTGLFMASSAIFFTTVIGLTGAQVGVGLSIAGVIGLLTQPLAGWLADQLGPRRVLVLIHLWKAVVFTAYLLTDDFTGFVIVASLIAIGELSVNPVHQALTEQVVPAAHRVSVLAGTRTVYNVGLTLGALLATVAVSTASRTTFIWIVLGNVASFALAAALLLLLPVAARPSAMVPRSRRLHFGALRDPRFVAVAAVNGVLAVHMVLLSTAMPLWVVLHTAAPDSLVGVLLIVNTGLVVALQVRASRNTDTVPSAVSALRRTGAALVLCCAAFAFSATLRSPVPLVACLIAAVVALTLGEMFHSAGSWSLSYALAPQQARTEYLATFNLGVSAQFVLGPAIVTVCVIDNGLLGWVGLAGCIAVAAALIGLLAGRRGADRQGKPSRVITGAARFNAAAR